MGLRTEPTQTTNNSPSPSIVGGPGDGASITPPAASAAPAPATTVEPSKKKFILKGREFESAEAALAYAEGLTSAQSQASAPAPSAPAAPSRRKVSEILFEDPDTAIASLKEEIKQEWDDQQRQTQQHKNAWETFYEKNSDLKGFEDEVEIQRQKHFTAIKDMTLEKAAEFLATETRGRLAKIRGTANHGEQLSSKPATVAGASGATPPPVTTDTPSRPSSLVDEIKEMQSKKGRKIS